MSGSTGSKIPLRGITKVIEHLDPGTRAKLESAFAEAEDLMDFHNRSVVDRQTRRRLSSYVAAPIVDIDQNNLGFDIKWDRLTDRRISFYEVQISLDSVFASPSTYTTVDTSLAVEGHTNTTFVRVRGVRSDGQTGPWSDSVQVDPQGLDGPVAYTRDITDVPSFYIANPSLAYPAPIQRISVTPQRINGGIMVFGSVGGDALTGDFELKVNEVLVQTFTVSNVPAVAFGPCFVSHDNFYFSLSPTNNAGTCANSGSAGSAGIHTGWSNLSNGTGAIESNYGVDYDLQATHYEVSGLDRGENTSSRELHATNFGFSIPSTYTIQGIEVTLLTAKFQLGNTGAASVPQMKQLNLIDGGVARTFSQVSNITWPGQTAIASPASTAADKVTFGGPTDLWGEADDFWTPAKINASNFGVQVEARFRYATASGAGKTQDDKVFVFGYEVSVYAQSPTSAAVIKLTSPNITASRLLNCTMNALEFGEGDE